MHKKIFLFSLAVVGGFFLSKTNVLAEEINGSRLTVIPKKVHVKTDQGEIDTQHYFVVKKLADGKEDPAFKPVECWANSNDNFHGSCKPFTLSNAQFLLVDCFTHNDVFSACRIVKFNTDGTSDDHFSPPFSSSYEALINGSAGSVIKSVKKVKELKDGVLEIDGSFVSSLVGWGQKNAEQEIGDDMGKQCSVYLSSANGNFISYSSDKK
jgi:hypothetical protein